MWEEEHWTGSQNSSLSLAASHLSLEAAAWGHGDTETAVA